MKIFQIWKLFVSIKSSRGCLYLCKESWWRSNSHSDRLRSRVEGKQVLVAVDVVANLGKIFWWLRRVLTDFRILRRCMYSETNLRAGKHQRQ